MLSINNKKIGDGFPAYIIAEIGINYNGDFDLAIKMVEEAARAGVDAVKVQIIYADKSYTKDSESYAIFKKVELPMEDWKKIVARARDLKIDIFATFTQPEDMRTAEILGLPAIKISSSNITNFPLLKAAARSGKPILVSTGMAYLSEVDEAVRYLEEHGVRNLGIFHCISLYPTSAKDANLQAITTMRQAFLQYPIGFSDHTMGNHCAIAAVALGARIIEKHFTMDRAMEGPDHHFSATPSEFAELVKAVRETESALGSGIKCPASAEVDLRAKFQRILVATHDIKEGEKLNEENMTAKRSGQGGLATRWHEIVLGRPVRRALAKDEPLTLDIL